MMLAIAGAMALLLGVFGLYGVLSYAVGIGIAIGLGGAGGFTQFMRSVLFGVNPLDPIKFAAVPMVLIAAAALASSVPARRPANGVERGFRAKGPKTPPDPRDVRPASIARGVEIWMSPNP